MKPLVIGEAPKKPGRHLEGRAGQVLADLANVSLNDFLARFERANLLEPQGRSGKGSAFDGLAAVAEANRLRCLWAGRTVVLLGYRVAAAFGVKARYFEPVELDGARVVVVPHPTGINRWYNEPANRARMAAFMRQMVMETNE